MKRLICLLLILTLASPVCAIEQDKVGHFAVGSTLAWVGTTPENGFWASVSVSAFKELADSMGMGTPEWEDFGAGVLGALLTYLVRTQWDKRQPVN